jgi:hypothetical protein
MDFVRSHFLQNPYFRWACLTIFSMVHSKLEAKAIYVLKQACGHDIWVSVYIIWVFKLLLQDKYENHISIRL